jgi:transcriptional regulator with XRE-family HTH domain
MGIGEKLDELIVRRRRNANDVAKAIGVPVSTIYSIIRRNNTKVDLDVLQKIADELCVTLDYFTSRDEKPQPYYADAETDALVETLHKTPGMRILFDASKDLNTDDLEFLAEMAKKIKRNADDE